MDILFKTNPLLFAFEDTIKDFNRKVEKKQLKRKDLKFSYFDTNHRIYLDLLKESYKDLFSRKDVGDFKYEVSVSNDLIAVYKNDNNKTINLIFKGTTTIGEIEQDLFLTFGQLPRRVFKGLIEIVENITNIYPGYKPYLIGHSLGGTKVLFLSSKLGYEGISFNPFIPRIDPFGIDVVYKSPGIIKYVNYGDKLSNNIIEFKDIHNLKILYNKAIGTIGNHGLNSFYSSQ